MILRYDNKADLFDVDLKRVFDNAIKWHSSLWIPDSDGDIDVNDCTEKEIWEASTTPFITDGKVYVSPQAFVHTDSVPPTVFY